MKHLFKHPLTRMCLLALVALLSGAAAQAQNCTPHYTATIQGATVGTHITNYTTVGNYYWYWGDNTNSTPAFSANASHSYALPGTYTIALYYVDSTSGCFGVDTASYVVSTGTSGNCQASFYAIPDTAMPNSMLFVSTSVVANPSSISYSWSFGDGTYSTNSTLAQTAHAYAVPGNYTVCLSIVSGSAGALCSDTICQNVNVQPPPTSCPPSFTISNTPGSGAVVVIINPYNPATYYSITFGNIYSTVATSAANTYIFNSNGIYTISVYAIDSLNTCYGFATQTVTISGLTPAPCQANFTTSTQFGTSAIIFTNTSSISAPNTHFYWSFGDGSSATTYNAAHTYANPGNYIACLSEIAIDTFGNVTCADSICQVVTVNGGNPTPNQFSGQLYSDSTQTVPYNHMAMIYLYELDSSLTYHLATTDTTTSQGAFAIPYYHTGRYLLRAEPIGTVAANMFIPTYFSSYSHWADADNFTPIVVNANSPNNYVLNIALLQLSNSTGAGSISGNIASGIPKTGAIGDPVPNVSMVLSTVNGKALRFVKTDAMGNYTLANLPYGTYHLRPEKAGIQAPNVTIVLGPQTPTQSTNWTLGTSAFTTSTSTGINTVSPADLGLSLYPNPATQSVTVRMAQNANATITLMDAAGRTLATRQTASQTTTLPLEGIAPGIYMVRVNTASTAATIRLVVNQ